MILPAVARHLRPATGADDLGLVFGCLYHAGACRATKKVLMMETRWQEMWEMLTGELPSNALTSDAFGFYWAWQRYVNRECYDALRRMRNSDRIAAEGRFLLNGGDSRCEVGGWRALKQEKCHRPSDCGEGANPPKSHPNRVPLFRTQLRICDQEHALRQGGEESIRRYSSVLVVSAGTREARYNPLPFPPDSVRDGIFGVAAAAIVKSPDSRSRCPR